MRARGLPDAAYLYHPLWRERGRQKAGSHLLYLWSAREATNGQRGPGHQGKGVEEKKGKRKL